MNELGSGDANSLPMTTAHIAHDLKALGAGTHTKYAYDAPDVHLLESFANPNLLIQVDAVSCYSVPKARATVHIEQPEFTSLCPLTGQPDFATIVIDYEPDKLCVESKSLKLYLLGYRNHGEFHEACVARIARDLYELLEPKLLVVEGRFTPRGGIPFWPRVEMIKGKQSGRRED